MLTLSKLGLCGILSAAALASPITVSQVKLPVIHNGLSLVQFTYPGYGLDGPRVDNVNSTVFDWWYFDAVSENVADGDLSSIVAVFYDSGGFQARPESPNKTQMSFVGTFPNGILFRAYTLPSQVVISADATGSQGNWGGFGSWQGDVETGEWELSFDDDMQGINGSVRMEQVSKAKMTHRISANTTAQSPATMLDEPHDTYAVVARQWGVTVGYVRVLACIRAGDKAVQDGTTRAATKNYLNCRRAANGVIPEALIGVYASHGEHCGYGGVDGDNERHNAASRPRTSSAVHSAIQRHASRTSTGSTNAATNPRSRATADPQEVTNPDLANYQGHEIYESDGDDSDGEGTPQGPDDFSDGEIDDTDLDELDECRDCPEIKALAELLDEIPAWFKLSHLQQSAEQIGLFNWHELMLFSDKKSAKYGVAADSARAKVSGYLREDESCSGGRKGPGEEEYHVDLSWSRAR